MKAILIGVAVFAAALVGATSLVQGRGSLGRTESAALAAPGGASLPGTERDASRYVYLNASWSAPGGISTPGGVSAPIPYDHGSVFSFQEREQEAGIAHLYREVGALYDCGTGWYGRNGLVYTASVAGWVGSKGTRQSNLVAQGWASVFFVDDCTGTESFITTAYVDLGIVLESDGLATYRNRYRNCFEEPFGTVCTSGSDRGRSGTGTATFNGVHYPAAGSFGEATNTFQVWPN